MNAPMSQQPDHRGTPASQFADRLDSWKEIAAYLRRGARTVQRWEREQQLPVHRLPHDKLSSVYAYRAELDEWWRRRGSIVESNGVAALAETAGMQQQQQASVAVLPFADLSAEKDQAYFCEGVAEEIINTLSLIKGLRVAPRAASFRFRPDAPAGAVEFARQLRVACLLEGSVRKAGNRVRIAVRLYRAEAGVQLWSATYERQLEDIFAVQDEVASGIATALEVTLGAAGTPAVSTAPATKDVKAYDYYLRGLKYYHSYGRRDVESAIKLFLRAIDCDSGFAGAYAGLADCWAYIFLYAERNEVVRQQAVWASSRAVELDPRSAHAWASHGLSHSLSGANDDEAERAFETAIRLAPDFFEAYYYYARHAFTRGNKQHAVALYEQAIRIRPDDYRSPLLAAQCYDDLGLHAEARAARQSGVEKAAQVLDWNPDDARALYMAANGLAALGEPVRARQWADRALALQPDDPMLLYNVACIFALLGDNAPAIDCLERAVHHGLTQRGWLVNDSNLDALRADPRFIALVGETG
jgi:adenylate cyclase